MNIVYGRRTAQERVTGGRWRRIVLGDVLAEHVVELRGRARAWPLEGKCRITHTSPQTHRGRGAGATAQWHPRLVQAQSKVSSAPCPTHPHRDLDSFCV